jgi:hypothetical protein
VIASGGMAHDCSGLRAPHADTSDMDRRITAALSILTGVALELGVALRSHRREAWDSEVFWVLGLPCALVACVAIGWGARDRDWRWTAAVVPAQVVTMMARNGDLGLNLCRWRPPSQPS